MAFPLSIDIYCAAGQEDLIGSVDLADGSRREVVLRAGRAETTVPAPPVRLTLDPALPDAAAGSPAVERSPPAGAIPVEAASLFGEGVAIPENGRLVVEVVWGVECHGELHVPDEGGRFGSYEHIQCALWIGYDAIG